LEILLKRVIENLIDADKKNDALVKKGSNGLAANVQSID